MAKSIVLANQGKVDNDKRITPSVIESQEKVKFITIFIYSALVFCLHLFLIIVMKS